MRLIDEFVEKVLNEDSSFSINIKEERQQNTSNYHFLQSNVGKARYIYGIGYWNDEKFYSKVDLKPKLVAIVSEGVVYVVDEFFLEVYMYNYQEEILLPECVKMFNELVKEINKYVNDIVFRDFYNALDIEEITDENVIEECRIRARTCLFSKEQTAGLKDAKVDDVFDKRDIANFLCGFIDIETEANNRLNERKSNFIYQKSMNEKIKSLMRDSETAFDWEIAIAEGIRSIDAKAVTVEFELNGKRAFGKINPDVIIRVLKDNDSFKEYNFTVAKHGEKLLKDLGAESWMWGGNCLKCKHITKITYRKKELYVRK